MGVGCQSAEAQSAIDSDAPKSRLEELARELSEKVAALQQAAPPASEAQDGAQPQGQDDDVVDAELLRFCAGKRAVLVLEEGQPEFIEQAVHAILRRADVQTKVHGKDMLPMAGELAKSVKGARWTKTFCALW